MRKLNFPQCIRFNLAYIFSAWTSGSTQLLEYLSSVGSAMALIVWLFALLRVVSSATLSCDTPVMFSENSTKFTYSQESLTLHCNASSYDQINWYHVPNRKTDLDHFPFSWCTPDTCTLYKDKDSQILKIGDISKKILHNSKIICVASCSATGKNATFYATLEDLGCVPIKPTLAPVQNVTVSLGETANLTCKAHMGTCYEPSFEKFIWVGNSKTIAELNTTNRYSTDVDLDDAGKLVRTLTIRDVTEEDLQSFDCILIDNHFKEGNVRTTIFLYLSEVNKKWDALVWHDDEHVEEASTLIAVLESMGYRVCTKEGLTTGPELQGLEALIDSSACVIILRKDDGMMMTVLEKAQENQSVVLIQTKADLPFVNRVEKIMNKYNLRYQTRRFHPPRNNGEINKSMVGFLKLYWPSHDAANVTCYCSEKLLRAEFYYRLRLKLPKQSLHVETEHIQMQ